MGVHTILDFASRPADSRAITKENRLAGNFDILSPRLLPHLADRGWGIGKI